MNAKETLKKIKTTAKKHKGKLAIGGAILFAGGCAFYCYKLRKVPAKFLEEMKDKFSTVEGNGPVWEKIKGCFMDIQMKPGDVWLIEAGIKDDATKRTITFIDNSDNPAATMIF